MLAGILLENFEQKTKKQNKTNFYSHEMTRQVSAGSHSNSTIPMQATATLSVTSIWTIPSRLLKHNYMYEDLID